MRVSVVFSAIFLMASVPVWAQPAPKLAPRTTLPAHVMCADVLVPALPAPALLVKGAHHPGIRLALVRGDIAVIARVADDGLAVGQRYLVRRLPTGAQAIIPRGGGFIPIRTPGWVTITALDEVNAMAHVDFACDAIERDDYLEPYTEVTLPTPDAVIAAPDFSDRVRILPGAEGRQMFGNGDTFSVAGGAHQGIVVGARYAIYRDRHDGMPLVHVGEGIVTDITPASAKLLLMTTTDAVEITDIAVARR